ncbi:MAG TPA: tetratricopeptide repeat protein [Pyrinomonadaceae bacterium]|jgi:soluble lytic murein transglycosylase
MPKFSARLLCSTLLLAGIFAQGIRAQTLTERHARIRSAVESGDVNGALADLQAMRAAEPGAYTLNNYDYLLGRLAEGRGDLATAASSYRTVAARGSLLSQYALWHLARLARATGNLPLEREQLRRLLVTTPSSLLRDAAQARLGESFYESADYTAAVQTLRPRGSARGNSSAREALALVGQAYLQSGQKDAARAAFSSLVSTLPNPSQPDDFALAGVRGLDIMDAGGEAAAEKSAAQLPESEHLRRAQVYTFNRDFAGARRHYLAIVERYAQSASVPEALYLTGRGFFQEGNYQEAVNYFQRVTSQYPDNANARDALTYTAGAYSRLKRFDEAVAAYQRFIERYDNASGSDRAYLNIVDILRDAGRDQDALSWVERTRTRFKGQGAATLALFSQARIHLSQGDWQAALADLEALRAEPVPPSTATSGSTSQTEISFMRAYTLEQLGRTEQALAAYMEMPEGRGEYYGGRATRRMRALAVEARTRGLVATRADSLRAEAQRALAAGQFEDARRAAQSALRLTEDANARSELLELARRAYAALPAYNNVPSGRLLTVGRQNVISGGQPRADAVPTHQALADELLFLGLYDEGAAELAVAENAFAETASPAAGNPSEGQDAPGGARNEATGAAQAPPAPPPSKNLSRDAAYTLAVLFKRGDNANHAIRFAEPLWKKVPGDYLLELAPREMVELLYPAPYQDALREYAPPRGVDPRFILSIMRQESRFRPEAKSVAAARGLLQFIPSTASTMATQLGLRNFRQDELYNPRVAVLFGAQYMGNLFKLFPEMPQAVAASYNGGEDNVARWVARARSNDPDRYVIEIGFSQSKDYVFKVLANYWVYQSLYNEQLGRR